MWWKGITVDIKGCQKIWTKDTKYIKLCFVVWLTVYVEYGQWVIDGDLITCPRLSLNFQPCSYLSSLGDFKKKIIHCNPALHHSNQQSPHSVVQFCPGGDPFVFVFHLCLYHCIVCIVFFCTYEYNFSGCIASINRNRPVHFWPGVARSVSENR